MRMMTKHKNDDKRQRRGTVKSSTSKLPSIKESSKPKDSESASERGTRIQKKKQLSLPSESEGSERDTDSDQIELQFQKIAANLTKDQFLIFPDSLFISLWTYLSYLVVYYETIVIPYRLSFHETEKSPQRVEVELGLEVFWAADMLLNLTTGFHSKGLLVMNRRRIVKNYLRT